MDKLGSYRLIKNDYNEYQIQTFDTEWMTIEGYLFTSLEAAIGTTKYLMDIRDNADAAIIKKNKAEVYLTEQEIHQLF